MKIFCNLVLLILMINQVMATNQVKDILYHGKDTLFLYDSPLEQIDRITAKIFDLKKINGFSSNCWRGFRAEWTIISNVLYLSNVYECHTGKKINKTIEKILGKKFENGLMKADWVRGDFWAGKNNVPEQTLYISIYKQEYKYDFTNGYLKNSKRIDYLPCKYFDDEKKITEFVIQNLDLTRIPDLDDFSISLSAYLQSNETGKIINVKIESSSESRYEDVIKKALIELPCLPVYFNRGEFWDVGETVYLKINGEDVKKHVR